MGAPRTFAVVPRERFDKDFPSFRRPQEVGRLSLDAGRRFRGDGSRLRYYVPPSDPGRVRFDLRKGYGSFIRKDESKNDFIDDILRWILTNRRLFELKAKPGDGTGRGVARSPQGLNTDFVCWRGLFTRLLCTVYENQDGWLLAVTLHNGTYYICEFDTERKTRQKMMMSEKQDEMCYWGVKFEQYLTADSVTGTPDTDSPVNNCEAFCTVIRTRLNDHSLGEVDCSKGPGTQEHYIELKTSRHLESKKQEENFKRYKMIKWWAQSFLAGVPTIVCGFRDDDGQVHELKTFKVASIPNFVKDIRNPWHPNICFNFLNELLTFIKKTVKTDDHRNVHLLSWEPGSDVKCENVGIGSKYDFLPEWYINALNRSKTAEVNVNKHSYSEDADEKNSEPVTKKLKT